MTEPYRERVVTGRDPRFYLYDEVWDAPAPYPAPAYRPRSRLARLLAGSGLERCAPRLPGVLPRWVDAGTDPVEALRRFRDYVATSCGPIAPRVAGGPAPW